jgi:hypothetical protein
MSVLRAAALEGLRRAVRRRRLVIDADPQALDRARRSGKLTIDSRLVAEVILAQSRCPASRAEKGRSYPELQGMAADSFPASTLARRGRHPE